MSAHTDPRIERVGRAAQANAERLWRAGNNVPAVLALRPIARAFGTVVRARRSAYRRGWLHAERVAVPVISIGNLTVGGTGKTPFTRWLTQTLLAQNIRPAILHGAYGKDEPALHRAWHPEVRVYAARDRVASARRALQDGAGVLLLDDGFQHLRLARDLDIVLVSADQWDQPRRLLPAGAWREPVETLRSAGAVVVTRKAVPAERALAIARRLPVQRGVPLAVAALEPSGFRTLAGSSVNDPTDVVLASAIADPLALLHQLEARNIRVHHVLAFDDHHGFTTGDVRLIRERAGDHTLLMTEKDAVKIALIAPELDAVVVEQRLVLESGEAELRQAVRQVIP